MPGRSSRRAALVSRDSSMVRAAMASATMPTGTLMKKIQPQCRCWLMKPPISGPNASAIAPIAVQMPIAAVRSLACVNVAMMTASVVGTSSAAPRPWTTRAAIRTAPLPARPAPSEASVKITVPAKNSRRLPKTSEVRPPTSSKPAKTST